MAKKSKRPRAARKHPTPAQQFIASVDASFGHAEAFEAARLAADKYSLSTAINERGQEFGDELLAALAQVKADRRAIIDSGKKLAARQPPLAADVLKIVNRFEMEPVSDAPAKIRKAWPKIKAKLQGIALQPTNKGKGNARTVTRTQSRTADRDSAWLVEFERGRWDNISDFAIEKKVNRDTMSKALDRARKNRKRA